jgi:anti-anti-sigma factor
MSVVLRPSVESNTDAISPTEIPPGDSVGPLVLDLSGVDVLTASGLGELVVLHKRLRGMGGELVLVNVNDKVLEVLQTARLTELFHVRPKGASSITRA